jgi:hypothetical protein
VDNKTYFHLAAFRGSVTNGTTNTAIAGVADNILTKASSGAFLAPSGGRIRLAAAGGVNASRARINTPAMRAVGLPYIAPLQTGITVQSPPNLADYTDFGPLPAPADEISVESTHTDAAPQIQFALMLLKFGYKQPTVGMRYRLRGTATITGVVGSWASGAITLDQTLPSGIYEIQGMDVFGTNLLGARLIFPGGGWRPGVLARNAVASVPAPIFLSSDLGALGQFDSVAMPQLEVYVEAANSAQEIYLDVVRVGDRAM